jgi:phosphoglycolate phosphatase
LIAALGLEQRAAAIVSGDTVACAKPFPDPLLHACETAGIPPENSVYIGDDQRDIQAGRAANMATIAAAWGYIGENETVETWGANATVSQPSLLLKALEDLGLR